jgi:hypothetical protein
MIDNVRCVLDGNKIPLSIIAQRDGLRQKKKLYLSSGYTIPQQKKIFGAALQFRTPRLGREFTRPGELGLGICAPLEFTFS